jgi:hypothetical protein
VTNGWATSNGVADVLMCVVREAPALIQRQSEVPRQEGHGPIAPISRAMRAVAFRRGRVRRLRRRVWRSRWRTRSRRSWVRGRRSGTFVVSPTVPAIPLTFLVVAVAVAHPVGDPLSGASVRASGIDIVLVAQLADLRPPRVRCLHQDVCAGAIVQAPPVVVETRRVGAFGRERDGQRAAGFIVPRLGALQRDPVNNGRRPFSVMRVDDIEELHRSAGVAAVKVGVEQGLLRAVHHVAKDLGRPVGSSSHQVSEDMLGRPDEHDSRVEPRTSEPSLRCKPAQAEQAV